MRRAFEVLDRRLDPAARSPVAVAFSGGSDSLSLLLVAKAWADQADRKVLALTVDHGLQPRSAEWTRAAGRTARRLGVGFRALAWRGDKPTSGVPAAARAARHRLLAEAAREAGAGVVLLGHTFDDQLENALMRGAGQRLGVLREWSPSPVWPEGRGLFHCRPLLDQRRSELMGWLAGQGLSWLDDPANSDIKSPRARARKRAAQGEVAEIGDGAAADEALARLAARCQAWAWGGINLPRRLLVGQGQSMRLLQIAAACVAGREALGRPDRARMLLIRIEAGEHFAATLGGARIEAGRDILVTREAGEFDRTGPAVQALRMNTPSVWDGRFELMADRPGLTVAPLRGHAARLKGEQRSALSQVPPAGRGALPGVLGEDAPSFCPALAGAPAGVTAVDLVARRFEAACGLIHKEGETSRAPLMADSRQPSYVSAEAKGSSE